MASTAKTQEFFIGDLDLRASSDLTKAGELSPADGIGLMTDCTVSMTTNEVKLQAGFPQRTYATAVSSRDLVISGTFSEYTVTNFALLYGDKDAYLRSATATEADSTLGADSAAAATDLVLVASGGTGFAANDYIYIQSESDKNDVYVAQIASVSTDTLTLTYGIPRAYATGSRVVKTESIILGSETAIPPVTVQVVGFMPLDGEPFVYDIWKATVSGTVEVSNSTDAFGGLAYTITPLAPGQAEIDCDKFGTDPAKKAMLKKFVQGRLSKSVTSTSC